MDSPETTAIDEHEVVPEPVVCTDCFQTFESMMM